MYLYCTKKIDANNTVNLKPMKYFKETFQSQLHQTIAEIENHSQVEIVTIVKPFSSTYRDIWFIWALAFLVAAFSFMMFSHIEFGWYAIYAISLLATLLGFLLPFLIDGLKRLSLKKSRMHKTVERIARAIFQKAGIRHTQEKIGVLIYISVFEKQVIVLPDRGAENAVPDEEWEKMRNDFQKIFQAADKAQAFIKHLKATQRVFEKYIPPVPDDVNELPDDLEIDV